MMRNSCQRNLRNSLCVTAAMDQTVTLQSPSERLRWARANAGYATGSDAARAFGWTVSTYLGHENGDRNPSREAAKRYASAFRIRWEWLLEGEGSAESPGGEPRLVPLVGYVGAGAQTHAFADGQGPFEYVHAPDGSTDTTVAVEIRGQSLGPFFDKWLIFYDDVHMKPRPNMIDRVCVVGLADGRVLVKQLTRGERPNRYTLLSQFEPPIYDAAVEWAALVRAMVPR